MQIPTGAGVRPETAVVERFISSLKELHVEAHIVRDGAETTRALRELLAKAGSRSVVVAGIPERYMGAVEAATTGLQAHLVEELKGGPGDVVKVLASADAGVTWAVKGLALEGAMLELVYDDALKLASALPIVHVALLEYSAIVHDLAEAMPLVASKIRDAPPDRKPIISFISGPSKTGDIEMRLLYGVHGPHTVHALILDWS
jgi:L-lactate dehydrogenase complex protein LldG